MAQVQNKYRTVQTSAATIRFTGAADGSDSSSSDDEAPPPSGHNSGKLYHTSVLLVDSTYQTLKLFIYAFISYLNAGPKDSLQKQESTNVQSGVPSEEVTKEAEIDDDSSSDRGSTGFSPHSEGNLFQPLASSILGSISTFIFAFLFSQLRMELNVFNLKGNGPTVGCKSIEASNSSAQEFHNSDLIVVPDSSFK